jgi:hypothetical protein
MEKAFLEDRRKGLEEAFFAEREAALLRRLQEAADAKATRKALSAASGITDSDVLDELVALGVSSETLAAFSLVPLVAAAWADGEVNEQERRAALSGAEQLGLPKGHAAYELFASWLRKRPPQELFAAWKDYIAALSSTLDEKDWEALRAGVLGRARAVAQASGGIFGVLGAISSAEQNILADLESVFAGRRQGNA